LDLAQQNGKVLIEPDGTFFVDVPLALSRRKERKLATVASSGGEICSPQIPAFRLAGNDQRIKPELSGHG